MNHCLLEVRVKQAPTVRYTQDNKTPLAEMEVLFDGLRPDDQPGTLKVVGWGSLAEELQNRVQINQKLIVEGRLRMNTLSKQDGSKEKKAELTLSKFHFIPDQLEKNNPQFKNVPSNHSQQVEPSNDEKRSYKQEETQTSKQNNTSWDSSPLVPETDEIPF